MPPRQRIRAKSIRSAARSAWVLAEDIIVMAGLFVPLCVVSQPLLQCNRLGQAGGGSRHGGEEWRDVEHHLLLGREASDRANLQHLDMVAPRIELAPAAL